MRSLESLYKIGLGVLLSSTLFAIAPSTSAQFEYKTLRDDYKEAIRIIKKNIGLKDEDSLPPNVAPMVFGHIHYGYEITVEKGDTLDGIVNELNKKTKNNISWTMLYEGNNEVIGDNPDLIYPSQKFEIETDWSSFSVF